MKLEVQWTQTIKPSWPTASHQRTHKLSLCDQLHLFQPSYVPILLFYSAPIDNRKCLSDQLKQSLSETLTCFYPFAGRIKDCFTVECNDEGIVYIETEVDSDMSHVVKEPECGRLLQLLPFDPHNNVPSDTIAMVMAAIQVNHFACGGIAIGVCINHVVADMSASATFLHSWAAVASDADRIEQTSVIYDCSTVFTPEDFSNSFHLGKKHPVLDTGKIVTQRFVFEGHKISCLRNEIGNASCFEAIMALIWSAMIETVGKEEENLPSVATMSLNLRNRLNPPLPQECIGNVIHVEIVKSPMEKLEINLRSLSARIRQSVRKLDDDYIRKLIADGECMDIMRGGLKKLGKNWTLNLNSYCRFPFYEIDFGGGKPIWSVAPSFPNRCAILFDTSNGEGIGACLTLPAEMMAKLEQDPAILTYATFKPSI